MVDRLRQKAGLPMPTVAVAPHEQPNAFATGRNPEHAVVAVTTGILKYMPQAELEGVIAHELAHIKNRDMLITTVAAGIAGALSNLPYLLMFGGGHDDEGGGNPFAQLALILLAPIGAMLIQFAVSRQREFEADRVGALILGRPTPLAMRWCGSTTWPTRFRCTLRRRPRRWRRSIRWQRTTAGSESSSAPTRRPRNA